MITKQLTLREIFPLISGNIAEYSVTVPESYESEYISINDTSISSESPLSSNGLVGERDDIENILSQARSEENIQFSRVSHGIIRSRFTPNTGLDENGRFVDRNNGPITKEMWEDMGMEDITFIEHFFHNIPSVPMLLLMGKLQGSYVRMLYLYSPVDNLVILFSMQGGVDQDENHDIWVNFVDSF